MVGSFDDINANLDNGDYYFYVSNKLTMTVAKNNLKENDVLCEPTVVVTSGHLMTAQGEIFISNDGSYYLAKEEPQDEE